MLQCYVALDSPRASVWVYKADIEGSGSLQKIKQKRTSPLPGEEASRRLI